MFADLLLQCETFCHIYQRLSYYLASANRTMQLISDCGWVLISSNSSDSEMVMKRKKVSITEEILQS